MADFKETCMECTDADNVATFCSSERKWINKLIKLADKHPDEVDIVYHPDDNDGVIFAHVPKSWMKLSPPKKMNLTDEQRQAAADRMRALKTQEV